MTDEFLLMVGTAKGLFLFRGGADRTSLTCTGPHFPGEEVASVVYDKRSGRLMAGTSSQHWGAVVRASDDLAATWDDPAEPPISFPTDTGAALARIWQLRPAGDDQPGVVYAGVEPAALFRSDDGGRSFSLIEGLWNHPHRPQWAPGGGGLCLHTVIPDPRDADRLLIAISAAGVYRTADGGKSWEASNTGIKAVFLPDPDVEFGQCVHKVARDPVAPNRLYLQHHWGVYRSDDDGANWQPIGASLPSDFGFPVVAHARNADTAFVLPLDSDERRWVPGAACRVFRTRDAGGSWDALGAGLPASDAYLTILRDAFTGDDLEPFGLWFGTRNGQVYGSSDEGEQWRLVADHLPPVLCVRATAL